MTSDILRRRAAAICRAHDIETEDPIASVANMARTYGVARSPGDNRATTRRVIEAVSKSSPFVSPEQMLATLDRSHLAAVPNAPKLPANLSHDEMVRGAEDLLGSVSGNVSPSGSHAGTAEQRQALQQRQSEAYSGRGGNGSDGGGQSAA